MKKSRRLQPVVKVAESREQQAARALGESQSQLSQAQQRHAELLRYKEEYLQRFHAAGKVGMNAAQMEDYRQFLVKLDQAIEQQRQVVEQAAQVLETKRRHWFEKRTKTQALDKVVSRYQSAEQRQQDRQEQNEQDEHAQQTSRDSQH
jgi:flagellar FliJ protein